MIFFLVNLSDLWQNSGEDSPHSSDMQVFASYLGKRLSMRAVSKLFPKDVVWREPLIVRYTPGRFLVFLKYGVIVCWGFSEKRQQKVLAKAIAAVQEPLEVPVVETVRVLTGKQVDEVRRTAVHLSALTPEKVAVVSLVVGRSLALEHFEQQVEGVLGEFEEVMRGFAEKGKTTLPPRKLLRQAAFAMKVRHVAVRHLSLLDKPDVTWEDRSLDRFYGELAYDYELDDRYQILSEKIDTIFRDAEFVLTYLQGKRSNMLEFIIILLIVIEIVIFVYELLGRT